MNILGSFAQRRHFQTDNVDSVKRSCRKRPAAISPSSRRLVAQITRIRTLPVFLAANSGELPILQELQQFRLQGHFDFVDPIKKKRAAVGQFDAPGLNRLRPGECALSRNRIVRFPEGLRGSRHNSL